MGDDTRSQEWLVRLLAIQRPKITDGRLDLAAASSATEGDPDVPLKVGEIVPRS